MARAPADQFLRVPRFGEGRAARRRAQTGGFDPLPSEPFNSAPSARASRSFTIRRFRLAR